MASIPSGGRGAPFGLVLAGGLARRMGGGDKTLLGLSGRPILFTLLDRMAPQCSELAISANGAAERFSGTGLRVIADPAATPAGPLAGVLAGLTALEANGNRRWLLTVPGDTPFIPNNLVCRLEDAARTASARVSRALSDGRMHPLVALWSVDLRAPLQEALSDRGIRGVQAFQAEVETVDVTWAVMPHDPFFNINTPEDLDHAEAIARTLVKAR